MMVYPVFLVGQGRWYDLSITIFGCDCTLCAGLSKWF